MIKFEYIYIITINEIGEKEVYKTSDFESIYKSLVDSEYSNLKSFITSDNKIKEIRVSGITIYTEDYLNDHPEINRQEVEIIDLKNVTE